MTLPVHRRVATMLTAGALSIGSAWSYAAGLSPVEKAVETVKNYSTAYMRLDVDAVSKLSHPILIIRAGGDEPYRHRVREMFASFATLQFDKGGETLGVPSEMFVDGGTMMLGVPAIRKAPGIATAPFVYVVMSYDGGESWRVLGLQCTDEKWLHGLAPAYAGTPDILGRANPAVIALASDREFDEHAFLKGPRWKEDRR